MEPKTLMDLLEMLKDIKKLDIKPTAGQLSRAYKKPLAVSPKGNLKVYPNGYAVYKTPDGDTVVWIGKCGKGYVYGGSIKDEPIPAEVMLKLPWYVAVAVAGEDAVGKNCLNRTGDRIGSRAENRNDHDDGEQEESARLNGGGQYENPECYVIRMEQIRIMLGKLSERQREFVILRDKYGFRPIEIAAIFTERRKAKGIDKKYPKQCVSKLLGQADFRLGYRKIPF